MADPANPNYPPVENPTPLPEVGMPSAIDLQYPQTEEDKKLVWVEKFQQLLIFMYVVIAVALVFRFVLNLFGAIRENMFVNWIYQFTWPLMVAFEDMFGRQPQEGEYLLEVEVLVALVVYALVFLGLNRLVKILFK